MDRWPPVLVALQCYKVTSLPVTRLHLPYCWSCYGTLEKLCLYILFIYLFKKLFCTVCQEAEVCFMMWSVCDDPGFQCQRNSSFSSIQFCFCLFVCFVFCVSVVSLMLQMSGNCHLPKSLIWWDERHPKLICNNCLCYYSYIQDILRWSYSSFNFALVNQILAIDMFCQHLPQLVSIPLRFYGHKIVFEMRECV